MAGQNANESYVEQLLSLGPLDSQYISAQDAKYKLAGLERWQWLWDRLEKMPDDNSLLVAVPAGHDCARVANCIRSAIIQSRKTRDYRWSVRQTRDEKAIVITRVGARSADALHTVLAQQREEHLTQKPVHGSTLGLPIRDVWAIILKALAEAGPCKQYELIDRVEHLFPGPNRSKRARIGGEIHRMLEIGRLDHSDGGVLHIREQTRYAPVNGVAISAKRVGLPASHDNHD